ncbi:hypothetical protein [Priestia aryabhattai]
MKKHNGIYIYSAYPIVDVGTYFSERAIKPIIFQKEVDPVTLLPYTTGFPKSYLLNIEHELSLKSEVYIFSSFLSELDFKPICEIAAKYQAEIIFTYFSVAYDDLYKMYKDRNGKLDIDAFAEAYSEVFYMPAEEINKGFIQPIF